MYYARGNFEAFARPLKPKHVDEKRVYLVGSGIASLAAAVFLIRDAQMDGTQIHILEKNPLPGGSCDACRFENVGFVMRGHRELDLYNECLWDLLRSIPAASTEDASVLDEFYRMNKRDPNYSLCRVTEKCGQDAHLENRLRLSDQGIREILRLFLTPDEELGHLKAVDVFSDEVLNSDFWLYFRTVNYFQNWHSALELKHCLHKYVHRLSGMADMKAMHFGGLNTYESVILPIVRYLETRGVHFEYDVRVTNVVFDTAMERKLATRIDLIRSGKEESIDLTENDLVFVTIGGTTENSAMGSQNEPAEFNTDLRSGSSWDLWQNIAVQDHSFGKPENFYAAPEQSGLVTATITTLDTRMVPYIKKVCRRDPFSGKTVTGGFVTCRDSGWLLNWTVGRQPQFGAQSEGQLVVWIYGMYSDKPGNYIGKAMRDCSGKEICEEWLYQIGVPVDDIADYAEHSANTVPVMMPFATSVLMPRTSGDRPAVVPDGSVNFAFLGQYAETPDEAGFSMEYSVRTAMEAVYSLLEVDRAVPGKYAGIDGGTLLEALYTLMDGKALSELSMSFTEKRLLQKIMKKVRDTDIAQMLNTFHIR